MDLGLVFAIGFLGSAHCLGMCGGFVVAVAGIGERGASAHARQALYALGKTTTYAMLGAFVGGAGGALLERLAGLQDVLSLGLGAFLVVVGLGVAGVRRRVGGLDGLARLGAVQRALAFVLRQRGARAAFGLGLVNGLLPCGLVYGLLLVSTATGSAGGGALTMAVFGLSTLPALYGLALGGLLLRPAWRRRLTRAGGVLVILLGLLTFARGTSVFDAALHGGHTASTEHAGHGAPAR